MACLVVLAAQLCYFSFNQAAASLAVYANNLSTLNATLTPPTFADTTLYIAIAVFVVSVILWTWWLGRLLTNDLQ